MTKIIEKTSTTNSIRNMIDLDLALKLYAIGREGDKLVKTKYNV